MRLRQTALLLLVSLLVPACATNPATGEAQLSFYGSDREVAMGAEADEGIVAALGLHPNQELQDYVSALGMRMAALSERPDLPWSFKVLDSPVVNAFALPGGYVYITRGMLYHLGSEAQLVAVLGHEIGHITGRHSVEQLSRAQLAQVGMIAATIASEDVRRYGAYAQQGLGLLFLKFGRDDETEADHLGIRYMTRLGYNPWEMQSVFQTLDHVTGGSDLYEVPDWLSSHPSPETRIEDIESVITTLPGHQQQGLVARTELFGFLDGMIYGDDPREGYFVGRDFFHPDLALKLSLPAGWTTRNEKSRAMAISPDGNSAVMLMAGEGETIAEAEAAFFEEKGVRKGAPWIDGYYHFTSGAGSGLIGFVEHGDSVLILIGLGRDGGLSRYRSVIEDAITSLRPLDDPYYLDVEPMRIELVPIVEGMSVRAFHELYPSGIDVDALAVLNGVPDQTGYLEAGQVVKRVLPGRAIGSATGEQGVVYR